MTGEKKPSSKDIAEDAPFSMPAVSRGVDGLSVFLIEDR